MYEDFFKLQARPFLPAPQVGRYYPADSIETARQTLARTIERAEGAGLIVGPPGTGKTLLCRVLAQQFADAFAVALLASGRLATRQALLQAIHYELGLPYRGLDEGELRLSLIDFLEPGAASKAGLLLIVDEAHTLSLKLLEELRTITNLVRDGQPRVRVVLAGGPLLEERFASPKLSSFAQRLAARCYLQPMNAGETAAYVRAQLAAVGGKPATLVDEAALASIYRATDGIPRLINQVCDHALILASLGGLRQLNAAAVEEAWADLQQLPPPCSAESRDSGASGVVEFGDLDDAVDDLPEAIPFRGAGTQPLHVARPDDQIDAIERQLAAAADVGPLAPSSTEVDLDFPDVVASLDEQFEEEEVVLDRYASDVEIFADVPRVSSWQRRPFVAQFEPADEAPAPQPAGPLKLSLGDDGPAIVLPPAAMLTDSQFVESQKFEFAIPAPVAPEGPGALWAAAKASASEPELIILEDPTPPAVAAPVRRHEYRQLFAKLRRG